ncbi:amino acid synthesis family protein [Paracoccus alcaliphilus]|nr:amino acid synthesis family protein [Paracoccus alcaliphilus]
MPGGGKDHLVKAGRGGQQSIGPTAAFGQLHPVQRGTQPRLDHGIGCGGTGCGGLCLQQAADIVDLTRARPVQRCHHGAAAGQGLHRTLGLQIADRLAHDRPGNAQLVAEAALHQPVSAGKTAGHDGLPQTIHRQFAQSLGELLTGMILEAAGGGDKVEGYGKAAVVGLDGELEHANAMIRSRWPVSCIHCFRIVRD